MNLQFLKQGIDSDCDCGSPSCHPEWMDMDRFERGKKFFQNNLTGVLICLFYSLTSGLAVPNLLHVLVRTGRSDTPRKALRRYVLTFFHIVLWHYNNVWGEPDDPAYKSIMAIRNVHNKVSSQLSKDSIECKDCSRKTSISQYDMALVQCGFMGIAVMYPEKLGINCTIQEISDYIFFWRCIGYLLGIDDKYNICSGDYQETLSICKEIEQEILVPNLKSPHPEFYPMVDSFIAGVNLIYRCRILSRQSVLARVNEVIGFCEPQKLGFCDRLRYWILRSFIGILWWCPSIMRFFNRRIYENTKHVWQNPDNLKL